PEALAQEHRAIQSAWTGNIDAAARHAERALALNPPRAHVWLELSRALALQKQWEPAEKFARAYLEAAPPPPLALRAWMTMALGKIQQMKGDTAAAKESMQRAKQLDPSVWFTMSPPPEALFEAP
ncbi:MAG: tetratricopeptide repeat protein, partial [Pirellulaceae bacterium]